MNTNTLYERESPAVKASADFARLIRGDALRMVHHARASHIGTCLSMADILACLYAEVLHVNPERPREPDRDRLIVSKGHGAAILYAALARRGFFPASWLMQYCNDGSALAGHVTQYGVPGVDASAGSLGHGLSLAAGLALAGKRDSSSRRVFCILSDGECDEGSIWEAILFAPHHGLDNLVAIVDFNKIQSFGTVQEVLDLEPFAAKWQAFNWAVREVDGHDIPQLLDAFASLPLESGRPSVIIAHTIKGKGVSFMENNLLWHYRAPNDDQLRQALADVENAS